MYQANYNGTQPNNTSYIKTFTYGLPTGLWKVINYPLSNFINVITPTKIRNLYIPGNLYVDGIIVNPSDETIKQDISPIPTNISNQILNLQPCSFTYKDDLNKHTHYGFLAQDMEQIYNPLVTDMPNNKAGINHIEIIPLLVGKVQTQQQEINQLRSELSDIRNELRSHF